jgi:hypothetical protein
MANADGSPDLLLSEQPAAPGPAQLSNVTVTGPSGLVGVWGVYAAGTNTKVLFPDSIMSIDYQTESRVSTYLQEKGAFASYNKVVVPFEAHVRMTKTRLNKRQPTNPTNNDDQSPDDIGDFLDKCEAAKASLDLYDVITPDSHYLSVTITRLSIKRDEKNGAAMVTVDMGFEQVRVAKAATGFANTAAVSGADPVNNGSVQAAPAPKSPTYRGNAPPTPQTGAQSVLAPASAAGAPSGGRGTLPIDFGNPGGGWN